MSNDTNMNTDKSISYGAKLKAAREALGLEQKDIAAQLRLGERVIDMLESGHYSSDIPTTFMRGYIRSYSKLLQMPDSEIAAALEPVQPAPVQQETPQANKQLAALTSSNYYMQFSTYAIVATLAGMLGLWWYNHTPSRTSVAQNQTLAISDVQNTQDNKQVAAAIESATLIPGATGAKAVSTATSTGPTVAAATPAAAPKPTIATKRVVKEDDDDEEDDNNRPD